MGLLDIQMLCDCFSEHWREITIIEVTLWLTKHFLLIVCFLEDFDRGLIGYLVRRILFLAKEWDPVQTPGPHTLYFVELNLGEL